MDSDKVSSSLCGRAGPSQRTWELSWLGLSTGAINSPLHRGGRREEVAPSNRVSRRLRKARVWLFFPLPLQCLEIDG